MQAQLAEDRLNYVMSLAPAQVELPVSMDTSLCQKLTMSLLRYVQVRTTSDKQVSPKRCFCENYKTVVKTKKEHVVV